MRKPLRISRFLTTLDLAWAIDARVALGSGAVTLTVTNGPPQGKRLCRFETQGEAENARRLMVAAARQGARISFG